MGNVISVIDALAEEKTGGENIEPKVMTADLAQSLYAGELRVPVNANMPRTGAMTNFMYGLVDTTDAFVNDTPEQIKILGGQYDVVMGGLKADEERIKRGRMNMDTANRNLQFNQQQRDMLTPDAAKDTFGYALGSGVASYGTMVVGGYGGGAAARALGASAKAAGRATGAAAYGTMAAMEVGGEVQERADKYAADTGDNAFKNYEPEKALKNLAAESAYGTISVILEKYLGFGEQRKLFNLDLAKLKSPTLRATAGLTKTGVKTAISEAGTEFAQSLANMGIDLIDGTMDWEQVPDRLKQELTGWAAAAVIGGTAGVGVGIYNRSRGIRAIKEEIRGTVPDADLERTASAIFDSAAEKMADVVSVELELSSQLRNKHGSVMDSMQRAVKQAVDESGAFQDVDEDMLAEYVVDTSKLFADQVLAEANIRNVPIEEVIQASDIVYENGGIRLKSQTEGGESRVLADSSVNVERERTDFDDKAKKAVAEVFSNPQPVETSVEETTENTVSENNIVAETIAPVLNETAEAPTAEENSISADAATSQEENIATAVLSEETPQIEENDHAEKIEDFGEKIEGARKDLWNGYKEKLSDELPEDKQKIKLSTFFPEPDYETAINNGINIDVLSAVKALHDAMPPKPKKAYKLDKWVESLKNVRLLASKLLNGEIDIKSFDTLLDNGGYVLKPFRQTVETYRILGFPEFTKANGYRIESDIYNFAEGRQLEKPEYRYRVMKGNTPVTRFFNDIQDASDALRDIINNKTSDKKVKLDLYQIRSTGELVIGKKVASGKFIDLKKGFSSIKDAREYMESHEDELIAELERKKTLPKTRREVNETRIGEEYRNGNISPAQFSETFGFRGVQFGNWVEQSRRADDLNRAYDALVDLSKILDVPTRAISLNGTLGLAFGARGTGGKKAAAAHYEPLQVVINLTKEHGAGSLAHEWFHALDNSFGVKADNNYMSEISFTLSENVRDEVKDAFKNLKRTLEKSGLYERSKERDKTRSKDYWSTGREMAARAFESYIIDKAAERGVKNDYLANIIGEADYNDSDTFAYVKQSEKKEIYAAFDKLFDTLQTRETDNGVEFYQLPQEAYDAQGKADINTPEFKEWFGDSKVVDEKGKPLEMVHFSYNEFSQFDKSHAGVNNDESSIGLWFADRDDFAFNNERYPIRYDVYLKMDNPLIIEGNGTETNPWADTDIDNLDSYAKFEKMFNDLMYQDPQMWDERVYEPIYGGFETRKVKLRFSNFSEKKQREIIKGIIDKLKAQGYDGIIIKNTRVDSLNPDEGINQYVVFEPNQIKSVYNRGTWNARNDNIYYQRAYAGSRVDYGRPSLEAIGSGEGAQAHGWGLYYALDKDVAEGYRERFINEYGEGIVEYNGVVYKNNDDYAHFLLNLKQTKKGEIARQREIAKFFNENGNIELAKKHKKLAEEGENINVDDIKTLGQVHEVEIPENPFLLDEQLPFSEQPEIVKQGIKNAIKEISEDAEKQIQALENKDFIGREIYNKISLFLAKTPGTLADKETSLLLEKYGIKGITYDGRQDGRAFVIFNPDDVQVIQKFYQLPQDDLNNVIDGHEVIEGFDENAPDDAFVRTKEGRVEHGYITDELAKQIGSSKGGEIRLYNDLDKHIDKGRKKYILSQGYADLIDFVDDTISNWEKIYKGSDESFLITKSKNKDNIVAVKLEQDGKYYKISTALISRKDYLKNKKTLAERAQSNQLLTKSPGAISGTSDIYNIAPTRENVKPDYQNKPQPKGLYDASKRVIKIFESADFSTLPHEIAHYWLDNMWSYVRSGNASEKYRQRWNVIANWLNVKPEQAVLTRGQQEKFARGYEQYLLNGDLPTPIIKGAFDDYDRWLKRVYGDMNRLNVRLSEDAVRFFQSMTTGILPPPRIRPSRKPREKMTTAEKLREQLGLQEQDRQEKETVKLVEEMEAARPKPDNIDARTVIVSNITEGEAGKSRVYSREVERNIDALQEIADIDLDYNKIRLEEQAQRAADFVKNNLEDARKIIDGRKSAPENILDTAIRIAYEQEMLRIGDNAEYLRALKLHSSLQTLRGQEIVAERISTKDIASPTYWINKLVAHRTYKAASKIFKGYAEAVGGDSPVDLYKKMIKNETDQITKKVLAEKTREEQQKVLNAELKRLRYEYGTGVQGELFQLPLEPLNARNAKMYVREALDDIFGTTVSQEEANQIIGKIGEIEKSIVNTLDETGNPSVQTWQKINEMNNLVESLTPSPALQIATSIVGRGMMLSSIKSPVLNVVSNTENILTEMLIRRAVNSLEGGASFSAVDKNVEKDYLAYADDVYRASGYNVSTTEGLDAATVTLGERRISTQGAGKFRAFARGVETGVFKYLMGYPDSRAKDFVFSDTAALEATTIAQNEGLSGEMLSKRATELYRDATRVAPLTEEGMLIREKAMIEANVATYTNDTAFSKFALGIRETLNKVTGNVRLGDQLMPFVKTPANVVALGMEYSIGAAYLIPNLTTVIRDVKAGKLSAKSRTAIKAAVRNGLGVVLAMLIAMALDPDDYTPDYDALTMSERRLALEKNAVFNSIRIGDKYISLDYFGPLAVPLTAVLSARRRGEVAWFGYAKGVASQLQKLPGLQEFSETVDAIGRATSNKPEKTVKNLNNALIDFVRARTIPSIVNDLAKSIDTYERETSAGTYDKAQASVPGIREELPLKYTTTSRTPKETEAALSILLFGARVKTAASNRVIYEIDRLYKKNAKPTITDVTRSGKLSELSEAKQQRVRKEFAKRYYDGVYTLIRTREYRSKDDEQRAAAINKVRRQIIEQLKKEYIK